jgi:hypothetical protein
MPSAAVAVDAAAADFAAAVDFAAAAVCVVVASHAGRRDRA